MSCWNLNILDTHQISTCDVLEIQQMDFQCATEMRQLYGGHHHQVAQHSNREKKTRHDLSQWRRPHIIRIAQQNVWLQREFLFQNCSHIGQKIHGHLQQDLPQIQ